MAHAGFERITGKEEAERLRRCDVVLTYSMFERYYGSVILAVICLIADTVLIANSTVAEFPVSNRVFLVVSSMAFVGVHFGYAFRNGRFVMAADQLGFYYRSAGDKGLSLIMVPWLKVESLNIVDDGTKELEIALRGLRVGDVPKPLNGCVYSRNDEVELTFYPGWGRQSAPLRASLRELHLHSRDEKAAE